MWDIIACWPPAGVGEVVTITCPVYFSYFSDQHKGKGAVFRLAGTLFFFFPLHFNVSLSAVGEILHFGLYNV